MEVELIHILMLMKIGTQKAALQPSYLEEHEGGWTDRAHDSNNDKQHNLHKCEAKCSSDSYLGETSQSTSQPVTSSSSWCSPSSSAEFTVFRPAIEATFCIRFE